MGSPKKQKKKFSKPNHPWQKERILAEQELLKSYGLRRKYELWKMNTILKNFTKQAKNLTATNNKQVEKERNQLLTKLSSLGLIGKDSKIGDILSLTLKDILERRLQTVLLRKSMAKSFKQARQLIVHQHISLGDKTITSPSFLVPSGKESEIQFAQNSAFINASHPERVVIEKPKKAKTAEKKTEEKTDGKKEEKKPKPEEKKEKPKAEKKTEEKKPAKKEDTKEKQVKEKKVSPKATDKKEKPKAEEKKDTKESK
jgi:small subunit ribosomal protein S4